MSDEQTCSNYIFFKSAFLFSSFLAKLVYLNAYYQNFNLYFLWISSSQFLFIIFGIFFTACEIPLQFKYNYTLTARNIFEALYIFCFMQNLVFLSNNYLNIFFMKFSSVLKFLSPSPKNNKNFVASTNVFLFVSSDKSWP